MVMGGAEEHVALFGSFCDHHVHLITTSPSETHDDLMRLWWSDDAFGSSWVQKERCGLL